MSGIGIYLFLLLKSFYYLRENDILIRRGYMIFDFDEQQTILKNFIGNLSVERNLAKKH